MKKKILGLAMVMAMLAVMVMPMAALASPGADTTTVSGRIEAAVEVTAPSSITLGSFPAAGVTRTGNSATAGNVYANVAWTLAVTASQEKTTETKVWALLKNGAVPLISGLGTATTQPLAAEFGVFNVTWTTEPTNTIATYNTQIQALTGIGGVIYGAVATAGWAIPLYVKQVVASSATEATAAGVYSVILTYTVAP